MHDHLESLGPQVEGWQGRELMDVTAKVVIYEAFVEGRRDTCCEEECLQTVAGGLLYRPAVVRGVSVSGSSSPALRSV